MNLYFKAQEQGKTYKLTQTKTHAILYWVCTIRYENGNYTHSRGAIQLESFEKGTELLKLLAEQATENDFCQALKDYFGADNSVQKDFIKSFATV